VGFAPFDYCEPRSQAVLDVKVSRRRKALARLDLACRCGGGQFRGLSPSDGFDLGPVRGDQAFDFKEKFEEDITSPFASRFSHSATVTVPAPGSGDNKFKTIGDAARMFPLLGDVRRDGMRCPQETTLVPVNNMEVQERVFSAGNLRLDAEDAEAALIFWAIGQQERLVVAEFSFRYKNKQEEYSGSSARAAMRLFQAIQRGDWFDSAGATKTEFLYGDTA
jgi:hypothetical protein